jgi:hypothetical protein
MTIRTYSFKRRFVRPIQAGLGILPGVPLVHHGESFGPGCQSVVEYVPDPNPPRPKRQTIRTIGRRAHAKPGDIVRCYHGMRTKQCSRIGDGLCTSTEPISIFVRQPVAWLEIDIGSKRLTDREKLELAQNDGFEDCFDMWNFWIKEHGEVNFDGVLIKWEPMR